MHEEEGVAMVGVTEYAEGHEVRLVETTGAYTSGVPESQWPGRGRLAVKAWNEGGGNCVEIDLLELLAWVKANRPELIDAKDSRAPTGAAPMEVK